MMRAERLTVHGIDLEVFRTGQGNPIVLLHGMRSVSEASRFVSLLGAHGSVLAPSCPGFGGTARPKDFDSMFDIVHLVRAVLDALPGEGVTLVGLSFGGWLAAEVAAAGHARLSKLVLVDPVGIKISDRQTADILDVFNRPPNEVRAAEYHDPDRFAPDFDAMEDAEIIRYARDRDALCLYGWNPYLYNPQLPRWLPRISVPTLVVWGESDGIVTPAYGRAFAGMIPGAQFAALPNAGHHPDVEQPEELARLIGSFVGS
jgi:pimeloyl-ACP methyl ester carboxylesterase